MTTEGAMQYSRSRIFGSTPKIVDDTFQMKVRLGAGLPKFKNVGLFDQEGPSAPLDYQKALWHKDCQGRRRRGEADALTDLRHCATQLDIIMVAKRFPMYSH